MSDATNADKVETAQRVAISKVYDRQGITPAARNDDFRCPHLEKCKSSVRVNSQQLKFRTGTWPYVGLDYGKALVRGHPTKILFVAMERWGEDRDFAQTQTDFRKAAEERSNPHMGGTAEIMESLVDDKVRESYSLQFALTNAVKCVEVTGRARSRSTATMIDKCAEHLRVEIDILAPDLIITQGEHPKSTILNLFPLRPAPPPFSGDAGKAEIFLGEHFVVLTTPHPAHKKGWRWKLGPLPRFLQEAVNCTAAELLRFTPG